MIALEMKGYLQAYKEILCFWLVGIIIGAVLWFGAGELAERDSLFEPFTVGVVDQDGTPELIFIFDFFNEYVIDLEFMEWEEASARLAAGDIPAFVELPENFTRDVFYGINSPFTVHVTGSLPLQSNLVRLLASGGIAYLSASQAGVYATLGYAYDAGMPWEDIQSTLLIPVNLAFAQALIHHDEMFTREVVSLVAGNPTDYFIRRFAIFWHMLGLLAFIKFLPWYSSGMAARFKLAGVSEMTMLGLKSAGLFTAAALMALPIVPIVGVYTALLSSAFITAFGLLSGKLFKHDGTRGLFIFFTALMLYFASGGIIPFVFLPQELLPMRYLSIAYWMGL